MFHITSQRMPLLFPDQIITKFKSVNLWASATSSSTGGETFQLKANSISDPMGTQSDTVQPTGVEQYSEFYNTYYVSACKVTLEILPQSNSDTNILQYLIMPTTATQTEATWATVTMMEQPYVKWAYGLTYGASNGTSRKVSSYMTTHKIYGGELEKSNSDASGVLATTLTDPVTLWYFTVRCRNLFNPGSANTDGRAIIRMTQYVTLYNRRQFHDSEQP